MTSEQYLFACFLRLVIQSCCGKLPILI